MKLNELDCYVIFSISVLILYAIAEFLFSSRTGLSHDTLTTCMFSAFGGECLLTALIQISKRFRGGEQEESKEESEDTYFFRKGE